MRRLNEMHLQQRGGSDNPLEARIQSMEMAFRMQTEAQEVFDLNRETHGDARALWHAASSPTPAWSARRLVERGVRVVQIYTGAGQPWDDHGDIANHRNNARTVDKPIAALAQGPEAARPARRHAGPLGRRVRPHADLAKGATAATTTTTASASGWPAAASRAAWPTAPPTSSASPPPRDRMHVHDLHATILHLMGIDHERLTYRYSGRDYRLTDVSGVVNSEIIA